MNKHSLGANMKKQSGFTMVEVMVVVAIISVLAAIALPGYTEYVTRGRIPDATSTLAVKRVQIEQFFMDNRTYAGAPACNLDAGTSKNFDFSCSASDATSYTLQAVGKGSMLGFTYTINQANAKATTAVPSGWASSVNCWVIRRNGDCV
jgi:type IV pilus assembly protein PilE